MILLVYGKEKIIRENTTLRIGIDYDIIFRKYFEFSDNKISIIFLNIGLDYGI